MFGAKVWVWKWKVWVWKVYYASKSQAIFFRL
jgi:hypothetical protein